MCTYTQYTHIYILIQKMHMHIYMNIQIFVYMYIHIYLCLYIYTHAHKHTHTASTGNILCNTCNTHCHTLQHLDGRFSAMVVRERSHTATHTAKHTATQCNTHCNMHCITLQHLDGSILGSGCTGARRSLVVFNHI